MYGRFLWAVALGVAVMILGAGSFGPVGDWAFNGDTATAYAASQGEPQVERWAGASGSAGQASRVETARAEWPGVLTGAALGEGEQTIQVPITAARTIVDETSPGNYIYRTVCFLAEMPDLTGATVTGASLKVYCEVFDPFEFLPQISNVPAHVGAPAEWDDETEDLSGISVQSGSPSEGITIDGVGWYSWDVLGDETVGLIKVFEDFGLNPGNITLTIRSHASFSKSVDDLVVTSVIPPTSVATFADTDDEEHAPYLELTLVGYGGGDPGGGDPGGGDPGEPEPSRQSIHSGTVGSLLF